MAVKFVGAGLSFTAKAVDDAAQLLGVDTHTILAITEVETAGCGFLAARRPQILFERHIFQRLTGGQFDAICPRVSAPANGGYEKRGAFQYDRLTLAMQLERKRRFAAPPGDWGRPWASTPAWSATTVSPR
jgi:hypothetical protein